LGGFCNRGLCGLPLGKGRTAFAHFPADAVDGVPYRTAAASQEKGHHKKKKQVSHNSCIRFGKSRQLFPFGRLTIVNKGKRMVKEKVTTAATFLLVA
jgi:hypothetical protein